MFAIFHSRFWSSRTLLALVLFDLALVCMAGLFGEQRAEAFSTTESSPRLSRPDDCKDQLIASLRRAELLGVGQRSQTWDRIGPDLQDAGRLDALPTDWAVSACRSTEAVQGQQISKQILLCVWLN
jgi:hypothetical protein